MNLRQISAFRAVMDCGSMTIAARTMGISQPNVSRLIGELEASTGLQLFERRAGRLFATAEGSAFHFEVERLFGGLDQLRQAASDIKVLGQGSLRIAATFSFAGSFLPRAIRQLKAKFPAAAVSLQLRPSTTIQQWAAAQQCDVGLAWNESDVPEVDVEPLLSFPGVCILPKNHRLSAKQVIEPKDLENEAFISFSSDDRMRKQIDNVFEQKRVSRSLTMETQYSAAIYALVAEGIGVSIVNPIPLLEFADRNVIARRFEPAIVLRSFILKPRQRPKSRLIDEFLKILRSQIKQDSAFFRSVLDRDLVVTRRPRKVTA